MPCLYVITVHRHNFTMKFPSYFHNYTGLNGLVNSFSKFIIPAPNKLTLGCKPHQSAKTKRRIPREKWLLKEVFYKNTFLQITQNSQNNNWLESLSNTVKTLQAFRFATLLKRNTHTGVLEPAVCISSLK